MLFLLIPRTGACLLLAICNRRVLFCITPLHCLCPYVFGQHHVALVTARTKATPHAVYTGVCQAACLVHAPAQPRNGNTETCCKVWTHETHCCSTRHVPRRVPRPCPCTTSVMKSRIDNLLASMRADEAATQETHYSCTRHVPRRVPRPCPCTIGVMKSRTDHLSAVTHAAEEIGRASCRERV